MYSVGCGDWRDETYSVLRPSGSDGKAYVSCGLTLEQAREICDELNSLISSNETCDVTMAPLVSNICQ